MKVIVPVLLVMVIIIIVLMAVGVPSSVTRNVVIFSGGHSLARCVSIDAEKRIAYDCVYTGIGSSKEIHLSPTDTWAQ